MPERTTCNSSASRIAVGISNKAGVMCAGIGSPSCNVGGHKCPFKDWPEFRFLPSQAARKWCSSWNGNLYHRGNILFYEGNRPLGLFFVSSGRVKIVSGREYAKQQILHMACAPALFGERSLLIERPYEATAQVTEDSHVYFLPAAKFSWLWESEPSIPKFFARLLAQRLGETQRESINLGSSTIRERLARIIASRQKESGHPGTPLQIAQSRQELAEMLATSTEVVCRAIGDHEHQGIIDVKGKEVRVLDITRLLQTAR